MVHIKTKFIKEKETGAFLLVFRRWELVLYCSREKGDGNVRVRKRISRRFPT